MKIFKGPFWSPVQPVPPLPSNSALRASLCRCWVAGPRRDIVVAQSLKCTVQSAQLKPPTKTQILCPHPLENMSIWWLIKKWKCPRPSQKMNLPPTKTLYWVFLIQKTVMWVLVDPWHNFENFYPHPQLDINFETHKNVGDNFFLHV